MAEPQRNDTAAPEALIAYVQRSLILGITTGRFTSGERLSPSLIAKELGVSHIPVREALVALEAVGHVEHRPRIGFSIRPLSLDDLSDIYRLRKVLEEEALELSIPQLTDDDIAEMEDLCLQMGKMTHAKMRDKYLLLNRRFHFVPFKRVGSERLLRMLDGLWDAAARYPAASLVSSADSHQEHLQMMDAVRIRDVRAVVGATDRHRMRSLSALEKRERSSDRAFSGREA